MNIHQAVMGSLDRGMAYAKASKKLERFLSEYTPCKTSSEALSQLAFMPRTMVMATLPHSQSKELIFQRKNGRYTLTMMAHPQFGLPYGSTPRILLAWLTTEAISKRSPEINLDRSLIQFLKKLTLQNGGGKRGNATRVRDQLMRLLTCHISCSYQDQKKGICEGEQFHISRSFELWWNPLKTGQEGFLPTSKIILAKDFFDEITKNPIPIDFQALHFFRKSPLQMDIYVWLTYRFSFLKEEVFISWDLLRGQFGSDYANDTQGTRNFKKKFLDALKVIWIVYPAANVSPSDKGLTLFESETHIKKKNKAVHNPVDNPSYPRCNGTA